MSGTNAPPSLIAVGQDVGGANLVEVYDANSGTLLHQLDPYGYLVGADGQPLYRFGTRVAVGDVSGDGYADIVTAPGTGRLLRAFDGRTGNLLWSFNAFPNVDNRGLFLALGDLDGDGRAEVVTAAASGASDLRVFSGQTPGQLLWTAQPFTTGGARVAVGDVDGDGSNEVIVGAGPGIVSEIKIYDGSGPVLLRQFLPYHPNHTGGVFLAAGDTNGDGQDEIVTSPWSGERVRIFDASRTLEDVLGPGSIASDGSTGVIKHALPAWDAGYMGGLRLGMADVNADGLSDILVVPHALPDANPNDTDGSTDLRAYDGQTGQRLLDLNIFANWSGGGFVGGGTDANRPPVPSPTLQVVVDEDAVATGVVTAQDANGDPLGFSLGTAPLHGIATVAAEGGFTYAPAANFNGTDSFTVRVADGRGGVAFAAVAVTVNAVNDPPVAAPVSLTTNEDAAATGIIIASDDDGDALAYTLGSGPANGTAAVASDGSFTYTPGVGYAGTDEFVVNVDDGQGAVVQAVVNVTVTAIDYAAVRAGIETQYQAKLRAADDTMQADLRQRQDDLVATEQQRQLAETTRVDAMNARLDAAITAFSGAGTTEQIAYAGRVELRDQTTWNKFQDIDTDYTAGVDAANAAHAVGRQAAADAWQSAVDDAEDAYQTVLTTATATAQARITTIDADYQGALDQAQTDYDSALTTADGIYAAAEQAAWDAYQAGYDALVAGFDGVVASAKSTRDAALADIPNAGSLLWSADGDPDYQAALAAAEAAYQSSIASIQAAYDAYMASLLETYNAAVAAADAAFDEALLAADSAYDAAVESAEQTYLEAVETADGVFDNAVRLLQTTFEDTVTQANTAYDNAMRSAATTHATAVQAAEDAYTTTTTTAQDAFAAYAEGVPAAFKDAVLAAAGGYISGVLSAEYNGGVAVRNAEIARVNNVLGLLQSLSQTLAAQSGKIGDAGTQALYEMYPIAEDANDAYNAAVSNSSGGDGEGGGSSEAAAVAYYDTVGGEALERIEALGEQNIALVRTLMDACMTAISGAAEAEQSVSMAQASAAKANTIARDVGQANYLQGIKDLIARFVIEAREKGAALEKTLNQAGNDRNRAIADANAARAKAEAAAGKTVIDAVSAAEKAYVTGYADAWDVHAQAVGDAVQQRDEALDQAARAWVTAALTADAAWTQATTAAAGAYQAGANAAYTSAVTSANIAAAVYTQEVDAAWAAALVAANPDDPNAQAVADAWVDYDAAVIAAWTGANAAAASAAIGYLNAESSASSAHASSVGQAVADQANAEMQAASDALADATAAGREFDDSCRPAAVERAKLLAQADTQRAQKEAAVDQTQTDTLADLYQTTVNKQADADQTYIQETVDDLTEFLTGAETAAAGLIGTLMTESADLSEAAAEENYQIDIEQAQAAKDSLISVAEMLKTRLIAQAERDIALNKTTLQKNLAAVRRAISGESNDMAVEISDRIPGVILNALYDYAYGGIGIPASGYVAQLVTNTELANNTNANEGDDRSAPSADDLLRAVFGLPTGQNIQITDNYGGYVGMYDPATGLVHRSVRRGERIVSRPKSIEEVRSLIDNMTVAWNSRDWDSQFGGIAEDTNPEDQPLHVSIITSWVGAERLAQPGGIGSTLVITVQLATEITGTLDPTPISDLVNAGALVIQGDYGAAAITLGSAVVPGGLDYFAKYAKRVPAKQVAGTTDAIADLRHTPDVTPRPRGGIEPDCPGANCFIAGTLVVVKPDQAGACLVTAAAGDETTAADTDAELLTAMTLVGVGLAVGRVRSKRRQQAEAGLPEQETPDVRDNLFSDTDFLWNDRQTLVAVERKPAEHAAKKTSSRRLSDFALTAAMLLCLLSGGGWLATNAAGWTMPQAAVAAVVAEPAASPQYATKAIETVELGRRLVAGNPQTGEVQPAAAIDPASWRAVRLAMTQDGVEYDLAFLRSRSWLAGKVVGDELPLSLPEMGLEGTAWITAVEPCPPIEPDDGTGRPVVTGTMRHLAANVLDLAVEGLDEPLGVTTTHPIWSEDRHNFIPAAELTVGERLRSLGGTPARIVRITPHRGPPVAVYNLEVDAQHVYRVGQTGLLVHNTCPIAGGGADVSNLPAGVQDRIQEFVNHRQTPVTVVGSRAGGTANQWSDYDYLVGGNSRTRQKARQQLPRGQSGGETDGMGNPTGIDLWNANEVPLDPSRPHIIFNPAPPL